MSAAIVEKLRYDLSNQQFRQSGADQIGSEGVATISPIYADGTVGAVGDFGTVQELLRGIAVGITASTTASVILAPTSSTRNRIQPTADYIPLLVRGFAAGAADLFQAQLNAGTVVFSISAAGTVAGINSTWSGTLAVTSDITSRSITSTYDSNAVTETGVFLNPNTGTDAIAKVRIGQDASNYMGLQYTGSGFTPASTLVALQGLIYLPAASTGGLLLRIDANAPIVFATQNTARLTISGTGASAFTGAVSTTSTLAVTGTSTMVGDLIFNTTNWVIRTNTSDGSDTGSVRITAASGVDSTRSGYLSLRGNENTSTGDTRLTSGSLGTIVLATGNDVDRLTITAAGAATFSGTLDVTGAITNTVLVGTGIRLVTSTAAGVHGNATTIDGNYTFTGSVSVPGFSGVANPTATIGLTAVNGSATSAIRSDGAPALSQAIAPTWTGAHIFSDTVSMTSTLAVTGTSTLTGDLIYNSASWSIKTNTSGGAHNAILILSAATGTSVADGAYMSMRGINNAVPGAIRIAAGNDSSGSITFATGNDVDRLTITNAGLLLVKTTTFEMRGTTANGFDDQSFSFSAGGSIDPSRGSYINMRGNDNGGAGLGGYVRISAGNETTGTLILATGNDVARLTITQAGGATFSGTLDVTGILAGASHINLNGATDTAPYFINVKTGSIATSRAGGAGGNILSFGVGNPSDLAAGNSEYLQMVHDGSLATLAVSKTGTGTFRDLYIKTGDTTRYQITAVGAHSITGTVSISGVTTVNNTLTVDSDSGGAAWGLSTITASSGNGTQSLDNVRDHASNTFRIRMRTAGTPIIAVSIDGTGAVTVPISLSVSGALAVTGTSTMVGDLIFNTDNWVIRTNTSNGFDIRSLRLTGGGAVDVTRGAYLDLRGNDSGGTGLGGYVRLSAGFETSGVIVLATGNDVAAITINETQGVTLSSSLTVANGLTLTNDFIYTSTNQLIRANTTDPSDTKALHLCGGDSAGVTRGGYVSIHGNEHASTGKVIIAAGTVTGGSVNILVNGSTVFTVGQNHINTFSTEVSMTGNLGVTGTIYVNGSNITLDASGAIILTTTLDVGLRGNFGGAFDTAGYAVNAVGNIAASGGSSGQFRAFGVGDPSEVAAGVTEYIQIYHAGASGAAIGVTKSSTGTYRSLLLATSDTVRLTIAADGVVTLAQELKLSSSNTVNSSTSSTVTNKVKVNVGGTDYFLLANTSNA